MKTRYVLMLAALLVVTNSAFARLGETRKEIDKRYGEGARSDIQRLEGAETIKYHFNKFEIEEVFHDDKSVWEIFHQGQIIGTSDIGKILQANGGDAKAWHYNGMNRGWERSGDPKYIGYRWPGHEDYFCIEDVAACDAVQNSIMSDSGGF